VADVAAVADPNTGVAVYDTFGSGGWLIFGGTSVGSPIVSSVYALAGNTSLASNFNGHSGAGWPYSHNTPPNTNLFDVISGSNGSCGTILCNAGPGWDGPTGLGTPISVGAF
jgi:subtilase family serine protease